MRIPDPERQLRHLNLGLHALGLLPILIGVGIVERVVFAPFDERCETVSKKASEIERLLRGAEQVWAKHKAVEQRLAEMQRQSADFLERLPSQPREEAFFAQVAQAAQEAGLQVRDYRPGTAIQKDSFGELETHFSLEGDYEALCGFLERLPKLGRPSRLDRLAITAGEQGTAYGVNLSLAAAFRTSPDSGATGREAEDG